jgi:hypothetical protein
MLTNHERGADLPQRIRATDQCGFANAYDDCMLPCVRGPLAHHPIDLLPHFAIPNFTSDIGVARSMSTGIWED